MIFCLVFNLVINGKAVVGASFVRVGQEGGADHQRAEESRQGAQTAGQVRNQAEGEAVLDSRPEEQEGGVEEEEELPALAEDFAQGFHQLVEIINVENKDVLGGGGESAVED